MQFSSKYDKTYKPRLTLSNRNNVDGILDTVLKIEFLISKILYGNNFEEV
tara:strand:+ start:1811 stop:1960 length:150 start_codon:yes stop_codon:yes gene_type:complete